MLAHGERRLLSLNTRDFRSTVWGAEKNGPTSLGQSRGGGNTQLHLVAADPRTAVVFTRFPGHAHDAPQGRKLLNRLESPSSSSALMMGRAYEDGKTCQQALDRGFTPVVPSKRNRIVPWKYDKVLYKRLNEVEHLFRRLKGFRRIFSRFEKRDVMFPRIHRLRAHYRGVAIALTSPRRSMYQ